jgi:cytochrome c
MRHTFIRSALSLAIASLLNFAYAAEKSTEAEAVSLIRKAQEYLKKNGLEKATQEFNRLDSPFNTFSDINKKGDLYLYSIDAKGYQAIHGKNPKIPGKVMIDMRDSDGVYIIRDLIKACMESKDGKGWTQYRWPNPVSKEVELKRGYVEKVPGLDLCLGTGIYQ